MEIDFGVTKRSKLERNFENGSSMYQSGGVEAEEGGSGANSTEAPREPDSTNYHKFTIAKLKQKMTEAGYGAEVLQTRNPSKKDLLALYEKLILNRPSQQTQ